MIKFICILIGKRCIAIFWAETNIGKRREKNEDYMLSYSLDDARTIYIVLDGIGGAQAGEIASKIAGNKVIEYLKENTSEKEPCTIEHVKMAVKYANRCVYELNKQNKVYKDMGTTIALIFQDLYDVYYITIGDSRVYEVETNSITQLSEDDTYVNALVRDNIITKEDAKTHPDRHVLLRALGVTKSITVDSKTISNAKDKRFLICTDGLTIESTDGEIFDVITSCKMEQDVCPSLVKLANDKGGMDNITVMYIHID